MKKFFVPFLLLLVFISTSCSAPTTRSTGPAWDADKFSQSVYAAYYTDEKVGGGFRIWIKPDNGAMILQESHKRLDDGSVSCVDDVKSWALENHRQPHYVVGAMQADKVNCQLIISNGGGSGTSYRLVFNDDSAKRGVFERKVGDKWVRMADIAFAGLGSF